MSTKREKVATYVAPEVIKKLRERAKAKTRKEGFQVSIANLVEAYINKGLAAEVD